MRDSTNLSAAYFCALSLVACRCAYLAAIPWKIIASRNSAKDFAQVKSSLGMSKPAVSAYHFTTCSCVGKPGNSEAFDLESEGSRKASSAWMRGQSGVVFEIVHGWIRLQRSASGWPTVPKI